jgi:transposase-like protein
VWATIARKACERGFTDQQVADLLGVNPSTLYRRAQYRQFSRAFRLGKELANNRVERALYERAIGYDFECEKQTITRHGLKCCVGASICRPMLVPRWPT